MKNIGRKILEWFFGVQKTITPSSSLFLGITLPLPTFSRTARTTQPMAKYFKDSEIEGLDPKLVEMLDKAREEAGTAIVITSGARSPSGNEAIGGVSDSSHVKGLGVDVRAPNDEYGKQVAFGLGAAGFKRGGFYDRHIHVDIDPDKPTPAKWWGKSK